MNGNVAATNAETTDISKRIESPSARIKKLSLELRRTAVYYVDSSIDVHNFEIIDTIHLKRKQIEAKLAEYNQKQKQTIEPKTQLMLTYPGFKDVRFAPPSRQCQNENGDITLDGLGHKKNTIRKTTLSKEFTKNITGVEIIKNSEPLPAKQKNYYTRVDWREEMKNRDKAKETDVMAGYTIGMPDYKEPDIKEGESQEDIPIEKQWAKTGKKWEKIKSKSNTRNFETKVQKEDEPFKINLGPVEDRNKVIQKAKVEDNYHERNCKLRTTDLHQIPNSN